jgi:spore coat protein U-like protein
MRHPTRLTYLLIGVTAVFLSGGVCHAVSSTVEVSATILSNHHCTFNSKAPVALMFGTLNPLVGSDVTSPPIEIAFECKGNKNNPVAYGVSDDDGLNETGSNGNRMKHVTLSGPAAFIPYEFTVSPTSGTTPLKTDVTLTITGKIFGSDYQTAYAGEYTDTVFVSINP